MELAEIEKRTRAGFVDWDGPSLVVTPLTKGGSGRRFVRIERESGGESLIAMHFTRERPDNERFAAVTDFLYACQTAVPRILARDEDSDLIWLEDLGETDLHDLREGDWETVRRPRYESTLKSVFRVHRILESNPPENLPELEPGFDRELYRWEQGYFFDHFVRPFAPPGAGAVRDDPALRVLAEELANEPRSLVHRDFQSTNVMLKDGNCYLIDYQGLRWGLPEYDVASMIYDPYCPFSEEQVSRLASYYLGLKRSAGDRESTHDYEKRLARCALQRLMQALGAYGFLGLEKGKREFLQHIPEAVARLRRVAVDRGYLPELAPCLEASSPERFQP